MINWQLSKQGIRWPVPGGHLVSLEYELSASCFCCFFFSKTTIYWPGTGFLLDCEFKSGYYSGREGGCISQLIISWASDSISKRNLRFLNCKFWQLGAPLLGLAKSICCGSPRRLETSIGGFHVTQLSLIITQAKNKIAYHSICWVKKLKYRRRVINKQRARVSRMCDIPNSSYSAKGFTENYRI